MCITSVLSLYELFLIAWDSKGLYHSCPVYFVNSGNYASMFVMELQKLLLNDKTISSCQTNVLQALCQTILNVIKSKNKLWITVGYQVFKNQFYNPFQSSSIFSILGSFYIKIFYSVISTFFEGFDFLFHSIWWLFQLFENCLILQDSSFNYQMNFLHRNLLCSVWWHKDSQRLIWQDNQSVGH